MSDGSALQTSASLLARLRQQIIDQAAWANFVRRYGPLVLGWCRHWHLQETDAQDVTQAFLARLVEKMRTFQYDPARSFRAYLKTLARYAGCNFVQTCKRPGGSGDSAEWQALQAVEAGDDLVQRLDHEFDQELLAEARAQVRTSGELLRQVVESEGKAIQAAARAGRLPAEWDAGACPALDRDGRQTDKTRVYLGSDGVMVPLVTDAEKQARRREVKAKRQKRGKRCRPLPRARKGADLSYKEFKIVTLYDDGCEHRLASVTRGDCEKAGELTRRDAGRVGLDKADDKVAVVDGADWIKNQLLQQGLPPDAIGLDFYHFAENVHKARRAVYGGEDPKDEEAPGNAWAASVLHLAKRESYVKLEEAVWDWAFRWRGAKRKAAEALLNYVSERDDMIRYKEFQEVGRQIGSGPTESMCKATRQRVKGVGMRWDAINAEALMSIEALEQSGAWQAYWDSHLILAA